MALRISLKQVFDLFKSAIQGFSDDKITKLSAALAYYTIFSMGPLLLVIISLCGLIFSREAVEGKVYQMLVNFVGSDTAIQLQDMIKNVAVGNQSYIAISIGIVMLLLGATSVFAEIQDSINTIWGLKAKPRKNWIHFIKNRFLSFSVIVSLGFLLLVSLSISTLVESVDERLQAYFPDITLVVFYLINLLLTIIISTLIFATIFKVLPDAKITWKDIFAGSLVTAILFLLGKFAISFYISRTDIGSTFGAAGSLVVFLVWTYYSSIILYFGAEFTKSYAHYFGSKIHPSDYAVKVEQIILEKGREAI